MPCFNPNFASWSWRDDGKKDVKFRPYHRELFVRGQSVPVVYESQFGEVSNMRLPCGKCEWCRKNRARQWSIRCMDEASLYEHNIFVTLTVNEEFKERVFPNGSLNKYELQKFIRRLRDHERYVAKKEGRIPRKIRYFAAGEYGAKSGRPHFHMILFNYDFADRYYWRTSDKGHHYDRSELLEKLWSDGTLREDGKPNRFGNCDISEVTHDSAGYVASYNVKKAYGAEAEERYTKTLANGEVVRLMPEFMLCSKRPAIGQKWFEKNWYDVYPRDEKVVDGKKFQPPRYYDKLLERMFPDMYLCVKQQRVERAMLKEMVRGELTYDELQRKRKYLVAMMSKKVRRLSVEA